MDLSQALVQVRVRSPGRHRQRLQPAGAERRGADHGAVQRGAARLQDPDRHLQRQARDRLRGELGHTLLELDTKVHNHDEDLYQGLLLVESAF